MGVQRRVDSIADKNKRKTLEELAEENTWLKEQLENVRLDFEDQLVKTQLAMCEMYEQQIAGGGS